VPRMKSSIRRYGYNQTEVLAKIISKYSGIPYMPLLEASGLYDTEQKVLDKNLRVLNVRNKFIPVRKIRKNKAVIQNKNILIIDDIITTGSTLSECARIIKNMGAENVYALCAASVNQ
jgi:ComF family protein